MGRPAGIKRKSGDRSTAYQPLDVPRGTKELECLSPLSSAAPAALLPSWALSASLFALTPAFLSAASVRGIVTDASGARVTGASVSLVSKGAVVGSRQFPPPTAASNHHRHSGPLLSRRFGQQLPPAANARFLRRRVRFVERSLVLEPAWVRESIVVTATGTPTPQPQTNSATTVLSPLDSRLTRQLRRRAPPGPRRLRRAGRPARRANVSLPARRRPDATTRYCSMASMPTISAGGFDFGPLSTTAIESAEVFRGPDTNLYGGGADSGVVSLTTPHGTTSFPFGAAQAEAGNFHTSRRAAADFRRAQQARLSRRLQLVPDVKRAAPRPVPPGHRRSQSWLRAQRQNRSCARQLIMVTRQRACPTRGISITLPTTQPKRIRTFI